MDYPWVIIVWFTWTSSSWCLNHITGLSSIRIINKVYNPTKHNRLFQLYQLEDLLKKITLNQDDCLSVVPLKATMLPIDRFIKSEAIEVRSSLGILKTEYAGGRKFVVPNLILFFSSYGLTVMSGWLKSKNSFNRY